MKMKFGNAVGLYCKKNCSLVVGLQFDFLIKIICQQVPAKSIMVERFEQNIGVYDFESNN